MDFATVRKKLANGTYATLDQFEVCILTVLLFPGSSSLVYGWFKKGSAGQF